MEEPVKKRRGHPGWVPGVSGNPLGRPKTVELPSMTNKELREKEFVQLLRKLRPHQSKAIMAAVAILDNKEAGDANKLRASAMLIGFYKDILKEAYAKEYDEDSGEAIQEQTPVFSLRMINDDEKVG